MNQYKWNLDALYPSYESEAYVNDLAALTNLIDTINTFSETLSHDDELATVKQILAYQSQLSLLARRLGAFMQLQLSTNTTDSVSKGHQSRFQKLLSTTSKAEAKFDHYLAEVELANLLHDPMIKEHEFRLTEIQKRSQYLKSDEVEEVIAKLSLNAGDAWQNLQSYLTSTVEVEYGGTTITLPQVRNLAYSDSPEVRKAAYEAEIKAYSKIKDGICFALNSIKGQVNTICELRGYSSPLEMTLIQSRMKQETLDAMLGAIRKYLPKFRAYLKRKGEVLGHRNGLPWYDLFALLGSSSREYTVEESKELLLKQFASFSDDMVELIERAYDEKWIDFLPYKGKVGGAFCSNLPFIKQSRILSNFENSLSDCVTLAHELGHAYHGLQIQSHSILNTGYTMPVAETASTFNETIVMQAAIRSAASDDEKLMLIESSLQDLNQVIVDIYSRFLFESEVFERRNSTFLFPAELENIMLQAQKDAYGEGLDQSVLHPFMWINKGHYYRPGLNFYNFPYAFGALFARGLYALYQQEGESFVPKYRELLNATTVKSVEDVALMANIDITKEDFWCSSLDIAADMIDEFLNLTQDMIQ